MSISNVNTIKRYRNNHGGYDSIVSDGTYVVLIEDCTSLVYNVAEFGKIVQLCKNGVGHLYGYVFLGEVP